MSCLMMSPESASCVTKGLFGLMNVYDAVYVGFSRAFKEEFWACVYADMRMEKGDFSDAYFEKYREAHLFRMFYRDNLMAYGARYKAGFSDDDIPEFKDSAKACDGFQLVKSLQFWLYQSMDSDDVYKSKFYGLIGKIVDVYMKHIFCHLPQYDAAVWG